MNARSGNLGAQLLISAFDIVYLPLFDPRIQAGHILKIDFPPRTRRLLSIIFIMLVHLITCDVTFELVIICVSL